MRLQVLPAVVLVQVELDVVAKDVGEKLQKRQQQQKVAHENDKIPTAPPS